MNLKKRKKLKLRRDLGYKKYFLCEMRDENVLVESGCAHFNWYIGCGMQVTF